MEKVIEKILINNSFNKLNLNQDILGYQKDENTFYFIETIGADQLEEIKNKTELQKSTWYRYFLSEFKIACENTYLSMEKNSSLLILVDSTDIKDLDYLQQQILLIEEDQYFVKKYVIIYTPNAVSKVSDLITNEQLLSAVNNRISFQNILNKEVNQDSEDYILLLQLFVKLPFLTLKFSEDEFVSLSEKLRKNLGNEYPKFKQLLKSKEEFQKIDFQSKESDNEIEKLLNLLTNDSN